MLWCLSLIITIQTFGHTESSDRETAMNKLNAELTICTPSWNLTLISSRWVRIASSWSCIISERVSTFLRIVSQKSGIPAADSAIKRHQIRESKSSDEFLIGQLKPVGSLPCDKCPTINPPPHDALSTNRNSETVWGIYE